MQRVLYTRRKLRTTVPPFIGVLLLFYCCFVVRSRCQAVLALTLPVPPLLCRRWVGMPVGGWPVGWLVGRLFSWWVGRTVVHACHLPLIWYVVPDPPPPPRADYSSIPYDSPIAGSVHTTIVADCGTLVCKTCAPAMLCCATCDCTVT